MRKETRGRKELILEARNDSEAIIPLEGTPQPTSQATTEEPGDEPVGPAPNQDHSPTLAPATRAVVKLKPAGYYYHHCAHPKPTSKPPTQQSNQHTST